MLQKVNRDSTLEKSNQPLEEITRAWFQASSKTDQLIESVHANHDLLSQQSLQSKPNYGFEFQVRQSRVMFEIVVERCHIFQLFDACKSCGERA